jgi:AcrR family transcriptional regulator
MMREAIFQAATTVLAEHGAKGLTMDRVALAADVAKGSLYHYFPGKKALLEFVYAKMIDPIIENLEAIVATEQPALEKLGTHLNSLLEHVAKHSQVFKLLFEDDAAQGLLQASQRQSQEVGGQLLAAVFRQGIAEGVFRPMEPLMLTQMFLGLCKGVFDTQPELGERDQRETISRLIMGTFLHGIATEGCPYG